MIYSTPEPDNQKGSILFFILIGVALFAALSYTVSSMMRGGEKIGDEKAGIYAAEILTYARSVKEAVNMVRISNGCADTDISFANPIVAGYTHTPASTNKCKIFNSDGGGLSWVSANQELNDGSDWYFTGNHAISKLGGTPDISELIMLLEDVNTNICRSINKRLGLSETITDNNTIDGATTRFTGTYTSGDIIGSGAPTEVVNIGAGCFNNPASSNNYFFQALIVR